MARPAIGADFTIQTWQVEEGLPQSSVDAIAQTPDGYLWLATYSGLARFDGVRFTVFDTSNVPGFPGNRLVQLFVDREGGLWVITEQRELARLKQGECRAFGAAEGVPGAGAHWVGEDGQGTLWLAGAKGGLWRWETNRFAPVSSPFTNSPPRGMVTDTAGRSWFNHRDRLYGVQDGRLALVRGPDGQSVAGARRMCAGRAGGLWILTPEILRRYVDGQWSPQTWSCPDFKASIMDVREDLLGNLWVATFENGLFRFNPTNGWVHLTLESGLPSLFLRGLLCDREGNVWVGTDGSGLLKLKPRLWNMVTRLEGLGVEAVQSVGQDQAGRVWLACGGRNPYCWSEGRVSPALAPPLSEVMDSVWSVLPARDGTMWIGTYVGTLFHYHDGSLTAFTRTNGLLAGSTRALFEDRQGRIWMGGFEGLSCIVQGQVRHFTQRDGLSSPQVWALAEGASGCLFVGTHGGGLNVWQDGRWTCYTREDGLADDFVSSLHVDAENGLWIGTHGGGLSRLQAGRFFNYRVKGGLPARNVGTILEDNAGRLWMATDLGIVCVSRRELSEFASARRREVDFIAFDRSDGLATTEVGGVQPCSAKARDGRLWFATSKGAAVVDPNELRANRYPPPVIIEEVRIDEVVVANDPWSVGGSAKAEVRDPKAKGRHTARREARAVSSGTAQHASRITVLPHQHRLEFRFTGLSYAAPQKVRFRYQMEGFDTDWVDGGTARNASYTRLPTGSYRFRVTACNDSGVWNETGSAVEVSVLPAWWQTWWLRTLALATVAALVFGLYEWRIHQLHRRRAVQHEFSRRLIASQEDERKRIAAELHDSLGQHLLVIKNMAALGFRAEPGDGPKAEKFNTISTLASQAIGEVRQIARALRPFELDRLGLSKALTWLIKPAADSSGIRFEVDLDNLDGVFPPEFEINLYRIVQEGVANILKHSQATTARVQVKREGSEVRVTIQDNGRGFVPAPMETPGSGGMGLTDMGERVRILGGELSVESKPGTGTLLAFSIPLPQAGSKPGSGFE